jgi:hypothetical protein
MEKMIAHTFRVGALLLLIACNKPTAPDCFQSAGDNSLETRNIQPFRKVELRDDMDYEFQQADSWSITLEGPENLLSDVETSWKDGALLVRNNNTCNWVRSFKKRIRVRIAGPLSYLYVDNYSTGGAKSVGTLNQDTLIWNNRQAAGDITLQLNDAYASLQSHTGVADVRLTGNAQTLELFNQGVGILDASSLLAQSAYVNNSSINDVYVNATNYLFAFGQFSGNIFYKPYTGLLLDLQMRGSGEVKTY